MTTKVKHYRNSFIDIQSNNLRVFMDPWINTANEGSWAGSKNGSNFILKSLKEKKVDYIYISHLHTDHFDEKFLKKLKKTQKTPFKFIIKKFKDNRLRNQLIECGFNSKEIIDVNEFEILQLNKKTKFIILPQESSSNTPSQYIKYDLDTSCVFIDDNVSIYNQVDNPYSTSDIKNVLKRLKKIINIKFDLAFIPYCAASEFPQSFVNLNRKKEKINIINSRIKKFVNIGNILNCKKIIPAGGSYKLDNVFSKLNEYLAVPEFKTVNKLFNKNRSANFEIINTDKFYFSVTKNKMKLENNFYADHFKSKINFDQKNIGYNRIKTKFSAKKIKKILQNLENSLPNFKKQLYDKTKTKIEFCIWDKQPVQMNKLEVKKAPLNHEIKFSKKKKLIKLRIHLYYKLLIGIVNKLVSWNEVQNHCLFERKPNNYDPDVIFWLNLYKF
tara:strand:- start:1366 stop:2691 length:1326 start_codon:yes stop_codon:yes gene_type:complete